VPHLRGGMVRSRGDPRADAGAAAHRRGGRVRDRSLLSGEGGRRRRPATRLGRSPGPSLSAVRRAAASRQLPAHGGPGLPLRRMRRDARPAPRGEGPCRAVPIPARPRAALRIPRRLDGGRGPGPDEPPARPGCRRGACRADSGAGPRSPGGRGVPRVAFPRGGVRDPLPDGGAVPPLPVRCGKPRALQGRLALRPGRDFPGCRSSRCCWLPSSTEGSFPSSPVASSSSFWRQRGRSAGAVSVPSLLSLLRRGSRCGARRGGKGGMPGALGSAGAVAGVLGAYLVFFPDVPIEMYGMGRVVTVPAYLFACAWAVAVFLWGWGPGPCRACSTPRRTPRGHLAGFAAGALGAVLCRSVE